jgi:hypothetical protein
MMDDLQQLDAIYQDGTQSELLQMNSLEWFFDNMEEIFT